MANDPKCTLAHYIKTFRAQHEMSQERFAAYCGGGIVKSDICHGENPDAAERTRSHLVPNKLEDVMAALGLTFAPLPGEPPTVAHICNLIDRADWHPITKRMVKVVIHEAGLLNHPRGGLGE